MTPYAEEEVVAFVQAIQPLLPDDLGRLAVNTARMQYDAVAMGYEASREKHLRELRIELGLSLPFSPAPRFWKGNMCGIRVPGLRPVPGGAKDPSLFLSWFYDDRYTVGERAVIRAAMKSRGYTHWLLSWPDTRAYGNSPSKFGLFCNELISDGFYPCVMLCSKDFDPHTVAGILQNIEPVLPYILGVIPAVCIGWELSLWLTPTEVQQLIDNLAPRFTPAGTRVYVHFQEGYIAFQQPGTFIADFWKSNTGKLTGVLAQKRLTQDRSAFLDWLGDCLARMAGGFGMPKDSGFNHPFDLVMLEITAQPQFNGDMTEVEGDAWGTLAINTPEITGPAGTVHVQGSGNGSNR